MLLNFTKTTFTPEPLREYYFGASSSPQHIILLSMDQGMVEYMKFPYTKVDLTPTQGFKELVQLGCENKLKQFLESRKAHDQGDQFSFFYPWMEERIEYLQSVLRGESLPEVNPESYHYWHIYIKYNGEGDGWNVLEKEYQVGVNGQNIKTGELECNMQWRQFQTLNLPADLFTITRQEPYLDI